MDHQVDTEGNSATAAQVVAAGAVLVDVRGAQEHATRRIASAINIPLATLDDAIAVAGPSSLRHANDEPKAVVVHCASGARSATAATRLAAAGFTSVVDIGAIDNWTGEGLPPRPEKLVKCDGCGAVMADMQFQAHCGEVEH
eukprot:SAG31_NODE_11880_length_989_cov_1.043820_1_plen_141_part_01